LTAESTQASLPECRSSSGCKDIPPTAALSASQRANRTAAWNASVHGVGFGEPVGGHAGPRPLDVGQGGARDLRKVGVRMLPGRGAREGGAQRARQ
jgi:hypothetical protein